LKSVIARVLACAWQRCSVAFVRDMDAHVRRDQRGLVGAALREVLSAKDRAEARERAIRVIAKLEPIAPKVCRLLEHAEEKLIAFYQFPREHRAKIRSTNTLERVIKEIGRRSDVVGISPNDAAVIYLCGALLLEQNDEWLV
jgi:transposase-like protein